MTESLPYSISVAGVKELLDADNSKLLLLNFRTQDE